MKIVGVLSDTHGHLYPEVREALSGVDHIVHAGDVGSPEVLDGLRLIAPVTAVRGNCDHEAWALRLPVRTEIDVGGVRILVSHIAGRPARGAGPDGATAVVSGHSHMASVETRDDVLYVNPGSAGPRRFGRPRTVALMEIDDGLRVTIIALEDRS